MCIFYRSVFLYCFRCSFHVPYQSGSCISICNIFHTVIFHTSYVIIFSLCISLLNFPYVINAFSFQVVYFTAVFPYVVLLILFFNGIFLSNAGEGIYFYIVPDFSRLLDPGVGTNIQIIISSFLALIPRK